jgi:hypothetical protein
VPLSPKTTALCLCLLAADSRWLEEAGGRAQRFEAKGRNHFSVIVRLFDADDPLGDVVENFIKRARE